MTLRLFPIGADDLSGYASYEAFHASNAAVRGNVFFDKYFPSVSDSRSQFDPVRSFNGNPALKGTYRVSPNTTFGYRSYGILSIPLSPFFQYAPEGVYSRTRFELASTFLPSVPLFPGDGLVISLLKLGNPSYSIGVWDNSRLVLNGDTVRLVYYHEQSNTNVDVFDVGPSSEWVGAPYQIVHALVKTATPNVYESRVYKGAMTDAFEDLTLIASRTNTSSGVARGFLYTGRQEVENFDWWFTRPSSDDFQMWLYTAEFGYTLDTDNYEAVSVSDSAVGRLSTEPAYTIFEETLSQGVTHADSLIRATGATAIESLTTTDGLTYAYRVLSTLLEQLGVTRVLGVRHTSGAVAQDGVDVAPQLRPAFSQTSTESVAVTPAMVGALASQLREQLQLLDPLAPVTRSAQLVLDTLQALDTAHAAAGAAVQDATTWSESFAMQWATVGAVLDAVTLTESLGPHLVVRALVADEIALDPTLLVQVLLGIAVQDVVQLDVGVLLPQGTLTWATNLRTGATTQYTQYPYTSFARRGTRYLATAEDGLYVLDGDTDNGAPIIAEMQSGFLQFAGSRFTSFKAIYLGMHASGAVLFKLETGDGKQYTYQVVVQNMETTKVRVGKGLRARYFAFELVTTGQDFDLDTVEFLPIGAQRRV